MSPQKIIEELTCISNGEAILYDGLEDAIVGISIRFDHPPVALYSYKKCVEILTKQLGDDETLSEEDAYTQAVEWLEFNTLGLWAGEYTPAFLYDHYDD